MRSNKRKLVVDREMQQMLYLIDFKVELSIYLFDNVMDIKEAHEKLDHISEDILGQTLDFYLVKLTWKSLKDQGMS